MKASKFTDARDRRSFSAEEAGRRVELTVVDTWSRHAPVIDPRFSYRGEGVVRTLDEVCSEIGYPRAIRVDQCTEFVSRDLDPWAYQRGVTLDFSRLGKPTGNAFILRRGKGPLDCLLIPPHVQFGVPPGVLERTLVSDACGCPQKDGDLAQVLQRRPAPQRNRVQGAGRATKSHRRSRPAPVIKPRNSSSGRPKLGEQRIAETTAPRRRSACETIARRH
jgi:transposase InsO family protein